MLGSLGYEQPALGRVFHSGVGIIVELVNSLESHMHTRPAVKYHMEAIAVAYSTCRK